MISPSPSYISFIHSFLSAIPPFPRLSIASCGKTKVVLAQRLFWQRTFVLYSAFFLGAGSRIPASASAINFENTTMPTPTNCAGAMVRP